MASRRDFIKYLGASSSIALVRTARADGEPVAESRPNVLFVLTDQWRGSALEMGPANDNRYAETGKQLLKTPRLKAFGEEGVRLDRAYATKPSARRTARPSSPAGIRTRPGCSTPTSRPN